MTAGYDRIRAALPGYEIGEQIGRGGCGVVLSGTHLALQRKVAIKQIPAQFASDAVVRRRFMDEARLMAAIDHPHVVPVYDYIEQDDLCLLVMEYLPGGTVGSRFAKDGFDAATAIAVTLACAAGLQAAHSLGVLHRDIKPANLMFTASGTVKLTDFGIAKIVGGDDTLVTRAGEIVGTPSYIAPEQARGQDLSPATDVYALATMVYQMLSGVLPFPPGDDSMAVLFMHAFEQPTPLNDNAPDVPRRIADVVMQGLATDPTERFASAEDFGIALAEPAAESWGSNWLMPVGIPVIGADTIVAAATRQQTGIHLPPPPPKSDDPNAPAPEPTAQGPVVKPVQKIPQAKVELADVKKEDVAPVQSVVKFRSPKVPFIVAGVLALLAIVVAFVGLGSPSRGGDLQPGAVTIAGVDPVTTDAVPVDLSKPIPVTVNVPADKVTLGLNVLGFKVGSSEAPLVPGPQGATAEVDWPLNPFVIAGAMTGDLTVSGPASSQSYQLGLRSTQSSLTTALAVATVVFMLFGAAYIESYIRALRKGRSRFSGSFGLPLSAVILAFAAVCAAWVLLGKEPTLATLIGTAVVAGGAGVAATIAAMRMGRTYRYRRNRKARERALAMKMYRER